MPLLPIAFLYTIVMCGFIGSFHPGLGLIVLLAYVTIGICVPVLTSKFSGDLGIKFRN